MSAYIGAIKTAWRYRRQIYRLLNIQDEWLKSAWMTTPVRNVVGRGGVTGIRHGLPAGQIIGGILNLGVPSTNPLDEFSQKTRQRPQNYKFSQKRSSGYYNNRRKYNKCIRYNRYRRNYARTSGY